MIRAATLVTILTCTTLANAQPQTPAAAAAQPVPPDTDVYVVSLRRAENGLQWGAPVNLTDRAAYDNQPSFAPDGNTLYYVADFSGQTEIMAYDLAARSAQRVTNTAESEYSPQVKPDGSGLTVVRVEADGVQRLWELDRNGENFKPVFYDIEGVGYYVWVNPRNVAMFIVSDPITLHVANLDNGEVRILDENIGRSLTRYPGNDNLIVYLGLVEEEKAGETQERGYLVSLDIQSEKIEALLPPPGDTQDLAWLSDGSAIMAVDRKLYRWSGAGDESWIEWFDFGDSLPGKITRLAVHPQDAYIALVVDRPAADE